MSHDMEREPVIPVRPAEKHAQDPVDFSKEEEVLKFIPKARWVSIDIAGKP